MSDILKAEGLVKRYGAKTAVAGVDLDVKRGEVVGLLGPNGAGKTTTFYMIIGLIAPDAGTISIGKEDITSLPMYRRARKGLGYLPQEPSVFRRMTVRENIFAVLEALGRPHAEAEARTEEMLDELAIRHIAESKALHLSGGERRRLEIARLLATEPAFILLDEPFAGIDPIAVEEIRERILQLKSLGIGIILSDHNVREALGVCDRAYVISQGEVLEQGPPSKIVMSPKAREIYLGESFRLD
ncbi:MAG: LPS export ABC transporter ATP-binding protein [Deltaproteobacteria bacterium]|nr:MAG: LPS export ABC transporter ATP-binding protein [Deltaproteobacteria bacterium]